MHPEFLPVLNNGLRGNQVVHLRRPVGEPATIVGSDVIVKIWSFDRKRPVRLRNKNENRVGKHFGGRCYRMLGSASAIVRRQKPERVCGAGARGPDRIFPQARAASLEQVKLLQCGSGNRIRMESAGVVTTTVNCRDEVSIRQHDRERAVLARAEKPEMCGGHQLKSFGLKSLVILVRRVHSAPGGHEALPGSGETDIRVVQVKVKFVVLARRSRACDQRINRVVSSISCGDEIVS